MTEPEADAEAPKASGPSEVEELVTTGGFRGVVATAMVRTVRYALGRTCCNALQRADNTTQQAV